MCEVCKRSTRGIGRRTLVFGLGVAGALAAAAFPLAAFADAPKLDLPAPKPEDTCAVCGMFVAKYPYWIATILFKDGHADHFDGAKDFFKYLLDMPNYARGRTKDQIAAMGVTGYYEAVRIDASAAVYVIGSDTLGPMGHELVPLTGEAEAREFLADHKGRRMLSFSGVTQALLDGLDQGRFE